MPRIFSGWLKSASSTTIPITVAGNITNFAADTTWQYFQAQGVATVGNVIVGLDGNYKLTGAKCEVGTSPTPFYHGRGTRGEFALVQRYFEKSYRSIIDPGTDEAVDPDVVDHKYRGQIPPGTVTLWRTRSTRSYITTKSNIVLSPVLTIYSMDGTSGNISGDPTTNNYPAIIEDGSKNTFFVRTNPGALSALEHYSFHFTVDADI